MTLFHTRILRCSLLNSSSLESHRQYTYGASSAIDVCEFQSFPITALEHAEVLLFLTWYKNGRHEREILYSCVLHVFKQLSMI